MTEEVAEEDVADVADVDDDPLRALRVEELSPEEAHRQLQEVVNLLGKQSVNIAVEKLGQLFRQKVWFALGYDTWNDLCEARLRKAFAQYRNDPNARDRVVGKLHFDAKFKTYRSIAEVVGIAPGTVRRAVEKSARTADGTVINTSVMKRRVDLGKSVRVNIDMTRRRAEALARLMDDNRWPGKRADIAKTSLSDLERIKETIDRAVEDLRKASSKGK